MTSGRSAVRWIASGLASAVVLFGMTRASAAPVPFHSANSARLRMSWTARPERIEVCRTLSAAELAEREEHMRQRVDCDGRAATYLLSVEVDGRSVNRSVVRGGGLRHDRPIHLLSDVEIPAGRHHVLVTFTRREKTDDDAAAFRRVKSEAADTGIFAGRAEREAEEHARRAEAAIPPRMRLDTALVLGAGQVVIVTFDPDSRSLALISEAAESR
jgi:hypothetical protein